jgi:hypothetical protein
MRKCLLIIIFFTNIKLYAQNKISFGLEVSALKSIGKNIPAIHRSPASLVTYHYNSREKFLNPYFNFLAHIQYNFTSKFAVGLESGIYYHYAENFNNTQNQSLIAIPVGLTLNHKLFNLNSKPFGVEVAAGGLFFNINSNWQIKLKNALIYNTVFFYKISDKHSIRLGLEKEVDRVWFYYKSLDPSFPNDTYKTIINRFSILLSYRYAFW